MEYTAGKYAARSLDDVMAEAQSGDPNAQFDLGVRYYNDRPDQYGVQRDLKESFRWHWLAARNGHPLSMYCVGDNYYVGSGVERNVSLALHFLEKAALPEPDGDGLESTTSYSAIRRLRDIVKDAEAGVTLDMIKSDTVRHRVARLLRPQP